LLRAGKGFPGITVSHIVNVRRQGGNMSQEPSLSASKPFHIFILAVAILAFVALVIPYYNSQMKHNRKNEIVNRLLAPILSDYPNIKIITTTHPDTVIFGEVKTQAELDKLRSILLRELAPEEVRETLSPIMIIKH